MTTLAKVTLDPNIVKNYSPNVQADCQTIIGEIQRDAAVLLLNGEVPPYHLFITLSEQAMTLRFTNLAGNSPCIADVRFSRLKSIMSDYDLMIGAHGSALRHGAPPARSEAIDMGRRAMHNEAAELLLEELASQVTADLGTARLLYTLMFLLTQRR